jgi:type VI secretion system protein ImpK
MSRSNARHSKPAAPDLDLLLQDSYLLVVELKQGGAAKSSRNLWSLCTVQIERVRQQLETAGLSKRSVDLISYAHCALLDETVLGHADAEARAKWAGEPMQARYFSRHQAGEFLYEEMRDVLRQPSPDPHVLTVYHRVLMLGFLGRYPRLDDPERQLLVAEMAKRVAPLGLDQGLPTVVSACQPKLQLGWLRSPLLHIVVAGLLLVATWWGLDYLLAQQIASLAMDQG